MINNPQVAEITREIELELVKHFEGLHIICTYHDSDHETQFTFCKNGTIFGRLNVYNWEISKHEDWRSSLTTFLKKKGL